MPPGGMPAITRVKHAFLFVPCDQPIGDLLTDLNEAGAEGFALACSSPVHVGADPGEFVFVLAKPVGIEIVGAGLIS